LNNHANHKEKAVNLTEISDLLKEESGNFLKAIQSAIDASIARRKELRKKLVEQVTFASSEEISPEAFFAAIDVLTEFAGDLKSVLCEAGFCLEMASEWLSKKSAPRESFRKPLLYMLATTVFDSADAGPLNELHQMLGEQVSQANPSSAKTVTRAPLDAKVYELPWWKDLPVRTRNCIKNDGIESLGEVLARTEAEWLRTPNFGRKSLNDLNAVVKEHYGVGLGHLSEADRERYSEMTDARGWLNSAAGELLRTHWDSPELKPEYKDLGWEARRSKVARGEEIYVQVNADAELLEALKQQGIIYSTQLATAPQSVIDRLCEGHSNWRTQLIGMLKASRGGLKPCMPVPLHLRETVVIYEQ